MPVRFTRVSTKGQVVIPADLRETIHLEPGTQVSLELAGDALILRPVTGDFIRTLRGAGRGKDLSGAREREHRRERH